MFNLFYKVFEPVGNIRVVENKAGEKVMTSLKEHNQCIRESLISSFN